MMYFLKKTNTFLLTVLLPACLLAGCSPKEESTCLKDYPIRHETEFGGTYVLMTIDDFINKGYQFGDSVRVEYSNGYILEDIPFYNGYYVAEGEPLLVGYPGYPYIKVTVNNGDDIWETADLDENTTATITLNEKGKYLAIMEARNVEVISDRSAFESDEQFACFRCVSGGNLKENTLYRSSSPVDDTYGRASFADDLSKKNGIRLVLNLSDSDETLQEHLQTDGKDSDYYAELYEEGKVLLPQLNTKYESEPFKKSLADVLRRMSAEEGPYMIHCSLGKDRTGFVIILLEMLAGVDYQTMADDYMLTYDSFYHVNQNSEPAKYEYILNEEFTTLARHIVKDEKTDLKTADLTSFAETYLREGGMTDEDLMALKKAIMK